MKTHTQNPIVTSQHTPGPWRLGVRQPTSDKFIYGSRGEEIADCDRKTNFADENLANARLVAAAPELLAALIALLEQAIGPIQVYGDGRGMTGKKTGLSHAEFNALRDERIANARNAIARAS